MIPRARSSGRALPPGLWALSLPIFLFLTPPSSAVTPFVHEVADDLGGAGYSASLAMDSAGKPRIAYFRTADDQIWFAAKDAGNWTLEMAAEDYAHSVSLALDPQDNPHISYTEGLLWYATKVGGTWVTETADDDHGYRFNSSIAVDAQGDPYISYFWEEGQDYGNVMCAYKTGGLWDIDFIEGPQGWLGDPVATSIALTGQGEPRIAYMAVDTYELRYAKKINGSWQIETVGDNLENIPERISLVLDARDNPRISYVNGSGELRYAEKNSGTWSIETATTGTTYTSLALNVQGDPFIAHSPGSWLFLSKRVDGQWSTEMVDESTPSVGEWCSLALDPQGNPCIAYRDQPGGDLRFADSGVHVLSPSGGETWAVGSLQKIEWSGIGPVEVSLSADGGFTYESAIEHTETSPIVLRVPNIPTRYARVKIVRDDPLSIAFSDSLHTIESTIALLALRVAPPVDGSAGAEITWNTEPGPEDLTGYRLEKAEPSSAWETLVALTRETSHVDGDGTAGDRYRLFAVNGLGDELLLGEAMAPLGSAQLIGNHPNPFPGSTTIEFVARSSAEPLTIRVYNGAGQLVRTLADGFFEPGPQRVTWNGLDASGRPVAGGVYFTRLESVGFSQTLKMVLSR